MQKLFMFFNTVCWKNLVGENNYGKSTVFKHLVKKVSANLVSLILVW